MLLAIVGTPDRNIYYRSPSASHEQVAVESVKAELKPRERYLLLPVRYNQSATGIGNRVSTRIQTGRRKQEM